jgi:hypothetical protein
MYQKILRYLTIEKEETMEITMEIFKIGPLEPMLNNTLVILTLLFLGFKYHGNLLPFQGKFNVIKIPLKFNCKELMLKDVCKN